jgi:two-component system response regulator YesN
MYRVVVIDDEDWIVKGLLKSLEKNGNDFTILYAGTDPFEAWDHITGDHPDIVISDIKMPGLSGLELIRIARQQNNDCEVILLSGFAEFELSRQAINLNVAEYLLKPFDDAELGLALEKVKKHLQDRRQYRNYKLAEQLRNQPALFAQHLKINDTMPSSTWGR